MKINLRGPMATYLGYGHCCFNVAKSLDLLGHDISYFKVGQPQLTSNDNDDVSLINKWLQNAQLPDFYAPFLNVWHEFLTAERVGGGPYNLLTFFESDTMDDLRKAHLRFPDRVIVASQWAKQVLINNDINQDVQVCPMGVDSTLFKPCPQKDDGVTTFINVGKKEYRKGHDVLIKAFNLAFEKTDNVALKMIWNNPLLTKDEGDQWSTLYKNSKLAEKVELLDGGVMTDSMYVQQLASADCAVFPTRSEGFGMPILQAMSCGLPVIVTNYSAPTEFCDQTNTMLIDVDEKEIAYDGKFFFGTGQWAKYRDSQMEQLVTYLRCVHKDIQSYRDSFGEKARQTAQNLSWERTGKRLVEIMDYD